MATANITFAHRSLDRLRALPGIPLVLILGLFVGLSGCIFDESGLPYSTDRDGSVGSDGGDAEVAVCGNGNLDQGENCDGNEFGGQTCATLGYDSGELTCSTGCQINDMGCSTCGDGMQQGDESCDGADLASMTCQGLSFDGGSLSCDVGCVFNTSLCTGSGCGDGVIDAGEQCDSADLNNETCSTLGYTGGVLSCDLACQLDTTGCDTCGDDVQTGLEDCDGTDMDGITCVTLGHDGGNLSCAPGCVFNESDCTDCGNDVAEVGEACDGVDLASADCQSQGFDGGTLTCGLTCAFDTSACTTCGDGQLDSGEQCDDGATNSDVTPDACRTNCMSPSCGDGVCDTPELGGSCPGDCKVIVFADNFDGAWPNGWSTGDNYTEWNHYGRDTWEPASNGSHSGPNSLWCAGDGSNNTTYDNGMGAWAVHTVDLSGAAGLSVNYDLWIWVNVTDGDDYFQVSFSPDGGTNWTGLENFNGDTGGWVFRSFDISAAAGVANAQIGLWFYSDLDWDSGAHGAYVDDIQVWYSPN